jgi:hypothetical protein
MLNRRGQRTYKKILFEAAQQLSSCLGVKPLRKGSSTSSRAFRFLYTCHDIFFQTLQANIPMASCARRFSVPHHFSQSLPYTIKSKNSLQRSYLVQDWYARLKSSGIVCCTADQAALLMSLRNSIPLPLLSLAGKPSRTIVRAARQSIYRSQAALSRK